MVSAVLSEPASPQLLWLRPPPDLLLEIFGDQMKSPSKIFEALPFSHARKTVSINGAYCSHKPEVQLKFAVAL